MIKRFVCGMAEVGRDERGEGYVDVLVKILITVVLGALLLALLQLAIPDIFALLIDRVRGAISL